MTVEKFRPSNGTEGDAFICGWCCICARSEHLQAGAGDMAPVGCPILDLTFAHDVEDPEYPAEWCYDQFGLVQCTAYIPEGDEVPAPRCPLTADMFPEAAP